MSTRSGTRALPTYVNYDKNGPIGVWHFNAQGVPLVRNINDPRTIEVTIHSFRGGGVREVHCRSAAQPIATKFLRGLQLAQMERTMRWWMKGANTDASDPFFAEVQQMTTSPATRRAGRPPKWTLRDYAAISAEYVNALKQPDPIGVIASERKLGKSVVRNLIHVARTKHELLTRPPSGRAGGELTSKAREILGLPQD